MKRFVRWVQRVTAFRIGLAIGLGFALLHGYAVLTRTEVPLVTRFESFLRDVKFHERGRVPHQNKVAIAAIDEKSIARYGRFPWDRHVLAELVDKLTADGAASIGFDMTFSDEDLSGAFAGADRFRVRFDSVSLATGNGRAAVDRFAEGAADIAGGASALDDLSSRLKPGAAPIFNTAKGRIDDGRQKLAQAKDQFDALVKEHASYARELEQSTKRLTADRAFADAIRRSGKVVVGWIGFLPSELDSFKDREIEQEIGHLSRWNLHPPEYREVPQDPSRAEAIRTDTPFGVKHYFGLRGPVKTIADAQPAYGFFNTIPDYDGVIRSALLLMEVRGHYLPSLELSAVAVALGVQPRHIVPVTSDAEIGRLAGVDLDGKLFIPTDERGLLRINYYGPDLFDRTVVPATVDRPIPQYPVADILSGSLPPEALRGQVVLVAATANGTFDERVTPFNKFTPGVVTHANAIQSILDRNFIRPGFIIQMLEVAAALLLALAFAFLYARVRVGLSLPVLLGSAVAVHLVSYAFFRLGYEVFEAVPLLEMGSMFVLVTLFRYATEERSKKELRRAFQLYLNPEVMEEMLAQPEKLQLGGDEKELTVLFSDIRGFTGISEKLPAHALVKLLNEYLTPMTDIVFDKRGTLDKYIGDAVMAFFGAPVDNPAHALHCCEAALQMMAQLSRLREKWRIEDPSIPEVDIGIGINSGPVVVGNMGSLQRFNYTVMGDNVNLASRLEGLNKEYGTHVLISEATLQAARATSKGASVLAVRELDAVRVKGRKEPVRLFELRGTGAVPEHERPLIDTYANGLQLYRARKFSQARGEFQTCLSLAPGDGPSRLFVARCEDMLAAPPGHDWDGVFKMEHK